MTSTDVPYDAVGSFRTSAERTSYVATAATFGIGDPVSIELGEPFGEQMARFGTTNFSQECTVAGRRARLAMTSEHALLAVDDGTGTVASAKFADVTVSGEGTARTVTIGLKESAVDFSSEADAQRFARVLGVRQDMGQPTAATPPTLNGPATSSAKPAWAGLPAPGTPGHRSAAAQTSYQAWARYALWASTVLLVFAALDAVCGVVLAVVFASLRQPLLGLLWLGLALGGSAFPVCLAALTRVVVYRHRSLDA